MYPHPTNAFKKAMQKQRESLSEEDQQFLDELEQDLADFQKQCHAQGKSVLEVVMDDEFNIKSVKE